MLKNYIKIAVRNILKYKMFSFINLFGLAVAMSVCMLIILMLADQLSYDQFNVKKNRIYRVLWEKENSKSPEATTVFPLSEALKQDYPFIEETTHLTRGIGGDIACNNTTKEMRGYFADPSFFDIFSFKLEKGNPKKALNAPNSIVLTGELAHRLFDKENPVGKTVEFFDRGLPNLGNVSGTNPVSWGIFTITGVIADKDYKSHLKFDGLVSSSSRQVLSREKKIADLTNNWAYDYSPCYTYVLLKPGKSGKDLATALNDLVTRKYSGPDNPKGYKLIAQPLNEITPGILVGNESRYSLPLAAYYVLSFLVLVVMLSACLNYTNLSTARALTRAKEIAVRKVNGANRISVIGQFLSESIITALLSLGIAIFLLSFLKSGFLNLWINRYLNISLQANLSVYLIFIGFTLLVGFLAGLYPAFYLSKFQPIETIKSSTNTGFGKLTMRKVLSVSQFVVSLFFITTVILVYNQFSHFANFNYGFDAKNIINVSLQGNDYQKTMAAFNSLPGVASISASDIVPATGTHNGMLLRAVNNEDDYKKTSVLLTDENFINNLGLQLVAGSNLPVSDESAKSFIVINETCARKFGYKDPKLIIGKSFQTQNGREILTVTGVVKDFHFIMPLARDKIDPLVIRNLPERFAYLNIKLTPGATGNTINRLEDRWESIDPVHSFKYEFYDEELAATHQGIFDIVTIVGLIAFLAIIIACLGLLGMATYTSERRTKEIGVRKVLGAKEIQIALLLSKEFLIVLAVSIAIAAPLSFFINNAWLQNIPNRVDFGIGTIFLGVLILLILGLITIGSQTLKMAKSNPADSLRME